MLGVSTRGGLGRLLGVSTRGDLGRLLDHCAGSGYRLLGERDDLGRFLGLNGLATVAIAWGLRLPSIVGIDQHGLRRDLLTTIIATVGTRRGSYRGNRQVFLLPLGALFVLGMRTRGTM